MLYCQYDVVAYAVDAVTCADATANRCAGSTTCVSDYIIVPGTVFTGAATATYTYDRYLESYVSFSCHANRPFGSQIIFQVGRKAIFTKIDQNDAFEALI